MNVGMGVMMNMLCGKDRGGEYIAASVGKQIIKCELVKEYEHDGLLLGFADGTGIELWDDGQSCCEDRYMHTDDALTEFVGTTFLGAEEREAPDVDDDTYGVHEVAFLVVKTSLGDFTIETHNEHNGYYGGFYLIAEQTLGN
jgi:hypothetical protein